MLDKSRKKAIKHIINFRIDLRNLRQISNLPHTSKVKIDWKIVQVKGAAYVSVGATVAQLV